MWEARRAAQDAADDHRAAVERAQRESDWLRHATEELGKLAPQPGEETALADRRAIMMQSEKVAEDLRDAHDVIAGSKSAVPALAGVIRRLERRNAQAPSLVGPAVKALDTALNALEETRGHLEQALRTADFDPAELERNEERLFALRAAGRKYSVPVDDLAALAAKYTNDIALIDAGEARLKTLVAAAAKAEADFRKSAEALSKARAKAAASLDKAVNAELKPLKLERAKFTTEIVSDPAAAGPHGIDRVEFWVQTNPGTKPGPLMKIASGGELARFLLALKVVLADRGSAPTLVFDEIDTGVGGAVADAIGLRLARLGARRAGAGGDACAAGRGAGRAALRHQQGCARQGQTGGDAGHRGGRRPPPRGNRPHAGRRGDHVRGPRRGGTVDQGGELIRTRGGARHSPSCPALCRASTSLDCCETSRGWPGQARP